MSAVSKMSLKSSSSGAKPNSSQRKATTRVFSPSAQRRRSKAQRDKRNKIMQAALDLFSRSGVSGASIEQIAERADVSKTNLLYYFNNKDQLYIEVIKRLLDVWLAPLKEFSVEQDPIVAISDYIRVKLEMSRDNPAESRLFCMEVVQGAPLLFNELESPLSDLIAAKVDVIKIWISQGKLANIDPYHLIFSIWATTQHYADFSVQIEAVTGKTLKDPAFFKSALENIQHIILSGIKPSLVD
jgi:TetR/AcrR family transcriptional regulator